MPANSNFDQRTTSNVTHYLNKTFADQVFAGRVLLAWLKENDRKKTTRGGYKLIEPLMESQNTTNAWMSDYDEVDLTPQTGLTAAEFLWKIMTGSVVMSEAERAWNRGESAIIDLWQAKIDQEVESAQNKLNTDAFASGSSDPRQITGLEAMVAATGTYGNISRTTYAFWRSTVDSTSEVLTQADMRDIFLTLTKNRERPDLILTTQTLYTKIMTFLDSAYRITDARMGKLGFESIQFMGVPVVYDDACTSGTVYFLNSKWLKFRVQEGWDFQWTETRQPTRQLVDARIMKCMGQLTSNNPRFLGKLSNKTAS